MKCPHCGKSLDLPTYAEHNVENYGRPALAITLCCSKPVVVERVVKLVGHAYFGDRTEDDWGNKIKK